MEMIDRIKSGTQYRSLVLEIRESDSDEMVVEGYATTFNQPYELYRDSELVINEQVDQRAFDEANVGDVIFQMNHEGRVYARTRNNTLEITPDEKGLFIHADLSGTEEGRKLYEEIKGGYTDKMSFGFIVDEDERKVTEDHETGNVDFLRTITKIRKLFDVSVVSIPANDATEITARGADGGVTGWALQEVQALRERRRKEKILSLKLKLMED